MNLVLNISRVFSPASVVQSVQAGVTRIIASVRSSANAVRQAPATVSASKEDQDSVLVLFRLARGSDSLSYALAQELQRRAQRN